MSHGDSGPYTAEPSDAEHLPWVKGPGNGFGYYSRTLFGELRPKDMVEAQRMSRAMNIAYAEGQRHKELQIQKALGLQPK